jgi:hypothetical protein
MNPKLVERQPRRDPPSPASWTFDVEPWPEPPCEGAEALFAALAARAAGQPARPARSPGER